jgi:uncharacterized protein YcbX
MPGDGFPEDGWARRQIAVGGAVLEGIIPTPRCVISTLAHDELPADPNLLRTLAREHRVSAVGRMACLGIYFKVVSPGPVSLGDTVSLR